MTKMSGMQNASVTYLNGPFASSVFFCHEDICRFDKKEYVFFPGFCDVHVHFREPGFSYKETVDSGSASAARGGYTDVCTMPNLNPVPDSIAHLEEQERLIKNARIKIHPYGAITVSELGRELSDMEGLASRVIAFSDDGRGVQSESLMRAAMEKARSFGKLIVAHCEDNALLHGGYIHDGEYARTHGHRGICSESEYGPIARDLRLAEEIGCAYHVCHISTKESVQIIREAKKRGVNVTCETAPHYLVMDDSDLQEDGRFKMNPPLRGKADREALIEGVLDGTIDMIATDHAPHSAAEKARGLENSAFGIVGLETAFSVLYTDLVKTGIMTLDRLVYMMAVAPRLRFGIPMGNDFTAFALSESYVVKPEKFASRGRATPFAGRTLDGVCVLTVRDGNIVYER